MGDQSLNLGGTKFQYCWGEGGWVLLDLWVSDTVRGFPEKIHLNTDSQKDIKKENQKKVPLIKISILTFYINPL